LGFSLYGTFHIGWLLVTIFTVILVSKYFKAADDKNRKIIQKSLAWFLILFEAIKNIYLISHNEFAVNYLPLELCSLAMFAILIHAYTNNIIVGEMLYSIFLPGGVAALLFCNWTDRSIYEFMCSFSFIYHLVLVAYCVMVVYAGVVKPNINRIGYSCLFLLIAGIVIYPLNQVLGTNFMFLSIPSPGSPLVLLEQIFGNPGYIFGLALIIAVLWFIMYLPWRKIFTVRSYSYRFNK